MNEQAETALADALAGVVGEALGGSTVRVCDLVRLSGGASRETWSFDAVHAGGTEELVLRRAPHAGLDGEDATIGELMLLEAAAMREAARVGVPEPAVLAASADPGRLEAPYVVMRRVAGETIARRILRDEAFAAIRPRLAAQCGTILAALHTMDASALPAMPTVDVLDGLRAVFEELEVVSPTFEVAFRWLDANRPTSHRRAVVHGDFRNGNLIVGPDGVRAVLDWELVHIGDPMEDLGWLCVRAWRFAGPHPVGGFGAYEDLFGAYEAASGMPVDRDDARWWELYGTLRWGVICVKQADRHLRLRERSVELAAVGRRVSEQEYDALALLEERIAR